MLMVNNSEGKPGLGKDAQLWQGILDGDQHALSQLFKKYYPPLLQYGLKILPRKDLVKDSIQELFFTIWKSKEELSDIEYVRSYLYSSFRRAIFRQIEIKDNRDDRDESYAEESFKELLNREQLLIKKELRKEQNQELLKAIKTLTKRQKEAVFLKFKDGLSNEEIAQVMEVNKQSVYNYIHRAVVALQEYLESQGDSGKIINQISNLSLNSLVLLLSSLMSLFLSR